MLTLNISTNEDTNQKRKSKDRPRIKSYIRYTIKNEQYKKAKVLSRQPKRGGKNMNWLNIIVDGEEKPSSVNWNHVTDWEELCEPEEVILFTDVEEMRQEVVDAKEKEIRNVVDTDVHIQQ